MKVNEKVGYARYKRAAKGCKLCVKGEKLVLFITGLCGQRCFYCPISEKKFGKDIVYANEWNIQSKEDLLEEIRLTDAKGAGITGGDPLVTIDKTCEYIKFLKEKMGKRFHIHLYTPLKLVTREALSRLHEAGLDEIRFHPDIDRNDLWTRISLAKKFKWSVGIEIPCIPDREDNIKKLINFIEDKVDFINLNELEVSDTDVEHYFLEKYSTRDEKTYAVTDSREVALRMLEYIESRRMKISAYFCSAKLKDKTQMGQRIRRRARITARGYDKITKDGMLKRGVIYLQDLAPGFDYRKKLELVNRLEIMHRLDDARKRVLLETKIKTLDIDADKFRLLLSEKDATKFSKKIKKLDLIPTVVEEYPTKDAVEVEITLL